jgi:sn-glycerol 3-phosphate transport system permease protein
MSESITLQPHVQTVLRPSRSMTRGQRWREIRNLLMALAFLAPSLIVFVIFVFIPLVRSLELSIHFTNPLGQMRGDPTFDHYRTLFSKPDFFNSVRVSVMFAIYMVTFTLIGSMILALLGNIRLRGISAFRAIFSSTIAVSGATASLIFLFLYNPSIGIFNYLLDLTHLPRVKWLTDTSTALFSVSLVSVWLQLGLNTIILLAGMQGIPDELYEAALIDGAGFWQSFRNVTLPLLSPTIFFLIVVDSLAAFQAFTQFNVLTRGGPVNATNTLVYSIFREFYFNGNYGYASAEAVILMLIMLVFTILQFGVLERRVHYQ